MTRRTARARRPIAPLVIFAVLALALVALIIVGVKTGTLQSTHDTHVVYVPAGGSRVLPCVEQWGKVVGCDWTTLNIDAS
ncbi:hypothetical protein [Pseudolysinimonas sp.]|uniref:hypothetical protein n=1 Tax=Pseudolysinimonas sp. TaxID=2680009 RepID=UPI003F802B68